MKIKIIMIFVVLFVSCTTNRNALKLSTDFLKSSDIDEYRSYYLYLDKPDSHFHVILTNNSSEAIKVFEKWNSWGWLNIEIDLYDKNNRLVHTIKRKGTTFTRNFPSTQEIEPGEHYLISINLNEDEWDIPFKDGFHQYGIKIRYIVHESEEAANHNVWTGKIETPTYKTSIKYNK